MVSIIFIGREAWVLASNSILTVALGKFWNFSESRILLCKEGETNFAGVLQIRNSIVTGT